MLKVLGMVLCCLLLIEIIYGIMFRKDPLIMVGSSKLGPVWRSWFLWLMRFCLVGMSISELHFIALQGSASFFANLTYCMPMVVSFLCAMVFMWPNFKTSAKA